MPRVPRTRKSPRLIFHRRVSGDSEDVRDRTMPADALALLSEREREDPMLITVLLAVVLSFRAPVALILIGVIDFEYDRCAVSMHDSREASERGDVCFFHHRRLNWKTDMEHSCRDVTRGRKN